MYWWQVLLGAALSGPLWILLTLWGSRRVLRLARRLSARARGQEHMAELGHLAAGLAHEIKNPLSTINLNLKLLAEDLHRSPNAPLKSAEGAGLSSIEGNEHRRLLTRLGGVRQEALRLKDILDDFLRYAGHIELQLAPVDLRQLVGELTDFFAPQAQAAKVILRTTLPEQPVLCSVDADLLKQAVLNLMINATQAMEDGGELLIRLAPRRAEAILEVTDTGKGIPPEDLPRIFQVYYSTRKGGTGLGLPTTQRIVREHGGTISVQSQVGKGTRFVIALPLLASDQKPGARSSGTSSPPERLDTGRNQ
jgi:signal transduction histidine kinase